MDIEFAKPKLVCILAKISAPFCHKLLLGSVKDSLCFQVTPLAPICNASFLQHKVIHVEDSFSQLVTLFATFLDPQNLQMRALWMKISNLVPICMITKTFLSLNCTPKVQHLILAILRHSIPINDEGKVWVSKCISEKVQIFQRNRDFPDHVSNFPCLWKNRKPGSKRRRVG
jgi:hypothetical protein